MVGVAHHRLVWLGLPNIENLKPIAVFIRMYGTMVRTKSGGDSTVRPEFVIRGMLFHPTRLKG
jgi:hypothetical protein